MWVFISIMEANRWLGIFHLKWWVKGLVIIVICWSLLLLHEVLCLAALLFAAKVLGLEEVIIVET
ncbi:MAG: hypothetical protein QXG68_08185 [Candidatus Bathyarchaeia archaeon]